MSDKDLDRLFKNKLEEVAKEPSSAAWDRIEQHIHPKRAAFVWWRIAAVILLLLSAGIILKINWGDNSMTEQPIAETSAVKTPEQNTNDLKEGGLLPEEEKGENNSHLAEATEEQSSQNPVQDVVAAELEPDEVKPTIAPDKQETENPQRKVTVSDEIPEEAVALSTELPESSETLTATITEPALAETPDNEVTFTGTTRSFNIEDFSNAEVALAEAESEENGYTGGSRLKKVWNVIKQVKEPENGLGDLREMKNELLAFGKPKKDNSKQ